MEQKYFEVPVTDMTVLKGFFGDKTINQIRTEAGLTTVNGGDVAYVEWLAKHTEVEKPAIKIIANPFIQ